MLALEVQKKKLEEDRCGFIESEVFDYAAYQIHLNRSSPSPDGSGLHMEVHGETAFD